MSESIDHSWICREDSGIERNRSFKERKTVTHNSVFAAHRLQCRMTNRKIDIRHFVFWGSAGASRAGFGDSPKRTLNPQRQIAFHHTHPHLFLNPRNMSCGKLPATIALDQRVRELHDSIERLAVRSSFHACFSENNGYAIAVKLH